MEREREFMHLSLLERQIRRRAKSERMEENAERERRRRRANNLHIIMIWRTQFMHKRVKAISRAISSHCE
jgi:hypothetical protein